MFVRILNLSFSYSDSVAIIRDANFQIARSQTRAWTGIVGPNGAGKTTLMRLIAGELEPSSGSVHFDGGATVVLLRQSTFFHKRPPPGARWSRLGFGVRLAGSRAKWLLARVVGRAYVARC
jgi:ATPase subunit of ABC transporter with duplicated ATPase domains